MTLIVNDIIFENTLSGNTISATTIFSGGTNLSLLFTPISQSGGTQTKIQNGVNTFTGGTSLLPTVNITGLTIDNLNVTGTGVTQIVNFSGGTISGGTLFSGSTDISNLFVPISSSAHTQYGSFGITVDGSGGVISTGEKGYVTIPYSGTIYGWDIIGNVSGSCIIDVYKSTLALFPPTSANTITGNQKPTLSNQIINRNDSLTGWTTTINTNDIISFNILSATTITRITLIIKTIKN